MSRPLPLTLALGTLAFASLVACPSRTPSSGGPHPEPVRIPPGCERSQAGEYHHVGNPAFRYLAEDDGRTLSLTVARAQADGGVGGTPDAGAVTVRLSRTPRGFVGETRATGFSVTGTPCPVAFPTEVTACAPDSLTLRTVKSTALDEACLPPPSGPPPIWTEQVLRRGAPDAGTPEGGLRPPGASAPRGT
jgi:hypothetical protein